MKQNFYFKMTHNESVQSYRHYAQLDCDNEGNDIYHICWDHDFIENYGVDWFSATVEEVEAFIDKSDGWVVIE